MSYKNNLLSVEATYLHDLDLELEQFRELAKNMKQPQVFYALPIPQSISQELPTLQGINYKEQKFCLPEKFNRDYTKFHGFVNHVVHPHATSSLSNFNLISWIGGNVT